MTHSIRPMRHRDAPELAAVDRDWDEAAAKGFLARPAAFAMVACDSGTGAIGGFIAALVTGLEAEIVQVTVARPLRRRGLGASLLGAFLAAHADKACFLEVREGNAAAIGLYRAHGFRPVGARRGYYRGPSGAADAVVMRLDTGSPRH